MLRPCFEATDRAAVALLATLSPDADDLIHSLYSVATASLMAPGLGADARSTVRAERLAQCPGNPEKTRGFSTLEARISVSLGPIRLLLGPLIISARVLEIWTQTSLASTRTKSC